MAETPIPDFIQKIIEEVDYEGYAEFVKLAKSYEDEIQRVKNNLAYGTKHYNNSIEFITNNYKAEALKTGKKFGLKEILHEPELTRKQDDFLKKISDHKEKKALKNDTTPTVEDQKTQQEKAKAEQIRQIQAERERNRQIEQERGRDR